ncbi:hypothetical protein [Staphylococcus nepalensis]|uniref:Uncharacterized protein n=3 Tax=Staphylococcus TaxID=1279 RepID=A0A380GP91_9STAP|nr:hypothetical protein [Staphylococcus nepalensis]GGB82913.1 hypothetical protein GCM10007203_12700 [Staphylococcus nepalensis]SUM56271.1 Uncharacterised protein [Staphylococcus nepalensis]VDG68247.1 Uncharacterised protein [Lacrimispora indolis]
MHIKIHGLTEMAWTLYFNNKIQKWLSIFDIVSASGLKVTSPNYNIILKRIKLWSLRPHYSVLINNQAIGRLEMIKILKGGIKQQTSYAFFDNKTTYLFNNPYLSTETTISNKEGTKIFSARRSFLDLGKNLFTQRRGEQHRLIMESSTPHPKELWVALYIQVMINKQKK